jgi:hypothetical protein
MKARGGRMGRVDIYGRRRQTSKNVEWLRLAKKKEGKGVSWGMGGDDDAKDEPDLSENPFA